MLATDNNAMDQATSSVWQLSQDRNIREEMLRHEEFEATWKAMEEDLREMQAELEEKDSEIEILRKRIEELEKKQH